MAKRKFHLHLSELFRNSINLPEKKQIRRKSLLKLLALLSSYSSFFVFFLFSLFLKFRHFLASHGVKHIRDYFQIPQGKLCKKTTTISFRLPCAVQEEFNQSYDNIKGIIAFRIWRTTKRAAKVEKNDFTFFFLLSDTFPHNLFAQTFIFMAVLFFLLLKVTRYLASVCVCVPCPLSYIGALAIFRNTSPSTP